MGNGSSSSRPTNTVTVQPSSFNQTSFSSVPQSYDLNPVQNNSVTTYQGNGTLTSSRIDSDYDYHTENLSSLTNEAEIDDSIETAVAPVSSVAHGQGSHPDRGPTTSSSRNSKRKQKSTKKRKHLNEVLEEPQDANDEIIFEVYRSHNSGIEYTVINNDGVRFYIDSWTTGEWQPFPEEWLYHGDIERQGTSDVTIDNAIPGVDMDDDQRMGVIQHPLKGELITYMMEEHHHVNCVFDPLSGAWLKLPLSWELHSPFIGTVISQIQETLPAWKDKYEILALLRQCNYNSDETITTYLTLLENDSTWNQGHTNHNLVDTSLKDDFKNLNNELQSLRHKISGLEDIIRTKDFVIVENQKREQELEERLRYSESVVSSLKRKMNGIQKDLEQAQQELKSKLYLSTKTPSSQLVRTPSPRKREVSEETVLAMQKSLESLKSCTKEFKNSFSEELNDLRTLFKKTLSGISKLNSLKQDSEKENVELRRLYNREALHRKLLYNKLQELRGNIRVFCRCRFDPEAIMAVKFPSDQEIQATSPMGEKTFQFDHVFNPRSSQRQVFDDTLPLITSCADGYNVCIMAYGQTGSGKTYTMMGTDSDPGVNIRSIQELLRICKERQNIEYTLTVSMLEVYNETLRDLLDDSGRPSQLNIQMKSKTVVVNDLTEIQVNSEGSICKIMAKGNANRSVGETKMNTNSSRSHLVVILNIKGVDQISNSISHGTLTLVDLAGSERISKTQAAGQRLMEAAAINKSLSALGQVFTALRTNAMHVPYRNSKLTQLLQGSLGGDGKACLFVNVSPAQSNLAETLSTLNFGSAAKQVQLGKVTQNIKKLPSK